jgi:hypothetical protein
MNIVFFMMR